MNTNQRGGTFHFDQTPRRGSDPRAVIIYVLAAIAGLTLCAASSILLDLVGVV